MTQDELLKLIDQATAEGWTELDLAGQNLTELPPEIGKLTRLEILILAKDSNGRYFGNALTELPAEIGLLKSLKSLLVCGNWRYKIDVPLAQPGNQLSKLPPEIGQLTHLQQLDLSENRLKSLPQEIGQLRSLQQLILGENRLSTLPPEIGQLVHIKKLDLSANQLITLPSEIGELNSLQKLDLTENQINLLPPEIGQLTHLNQLDLRSNKLNMLPPEIGGLANLKKLYLSYNKLTELPSEIGNLTRLKELEIVENQLTSFLSETSQLVNLQRLDLSENRLSTLPSEIGELTSLKQFDFGGNPLEDPPPEIIAKGSLHVVSYLRQQLEQGREYLYEAKFLIVGEGGAGKTSLAKKLLNPHYELDVQECSTEGIDVIHWEFKLRDGTTFRANIWDFGGQEIYHATHQFFLTKRSLYALVVDVRQDNTDLYYWLSIVNLLSESSPVFIVKNEKQDRQCEVNERQLKSEFMDSLEKVCTTNLADNRGLNEIKIAIQNRIAQLPHVGTPLPKKWVEIRRTLEMDERNYILFHEYIRICELNEFTQIANQLQLSEYLHDLGVCLHFQKDPVLKHFVILKPEWGTAAVYKALDTKAVRDNCGRFTRIQLNEIWSEHQYADMRDELLQLMMRFKLCYEIPGCSQHYIAPQLLGINAPEYDWNDSANLIFRYRYDFMPKGILTRIIVELHEYIEDQQLVWKTGVVLTSGSARAEVIEHYPRSEIRIRVSGSDQKRWLSAITHELEKIHRSYNSADNPTENRLRYQTLIPCNCSVCIGRQNPHDYPYKVLQQFLRDRQNTIQCQKSYQMVDVRRLLDDILYGALDVLPMQESMSRSDDDPQSFPQQGISSIVQTAQKQVYRPSRQERLNLIQTINTLPKPQFEELVYALNPPPGILPSNIAAQGNRASELLRWAEGAKDIGLPAILEVLEAMNVPLSPRPDHS